MPQEKDRRQAPDHYDDDVIDTTAEGRQRREELDEETEEILDEIDDVLEDNAQDFVRSYIQKGGQ